MHTHTLHAHIHIGKDYINKDDNGLIKMFATKNTDWRLIIHGTEGALQIDYYSDLAFDDLSMHQYCPIVENANMMSFCLGNETCFEDLENQCPSGEKFTTEMIHAFIQNIENSTDWG